MDPKEIKVGDFVNVRMQITRKNDTDFRAIPMTKPCVHCAVEHVFSFDEIAAFSPISSAPKYDPCRKFRKGDKVRLVEYKGRHFNADAKRMYFCTGIVTFSECEHEYIDVCVSFGNSEEDIEIDPAYLELVKPVEELGPYSVRESDTINGFDIMRDGMCVMTFPYGSKEAGYYRNKLAAKEAAEAECARLNEEWRKEYEQAKSHV